MMGIAKLHVGSAHTYLMKHVARSDIVGKATPEDLAKYHSDGGDRPGQWWGKGVAGLAVDGVDGVSVGAVVSDAQMLALFGQGRHPDAVQISELMVQGGADEAAVKRATTLGRAFRQSSQHKLHDDFELARAEARKQAREGGTRRGDMDIARDFFEVAHGRAPLDSQELSSFAYELARAPHAVAGYDLTFTPVKSVSVLWGLGDDDVREAVEKAHNDAMCEALRFLEDDVAASRRGNGGARSVEVKGLVATQFFHRDSRDGDPNFHTHVAVANRVQDAEDGSWLTLDGRLLYKATVAASERYNSALEARLSHDLGLSFVERDDKKKRPVREVEGIPQAVCESFSSRRKAIEREAKQRIEAFCAAYGRTPTAVESERIYQDATLATRQSKHTPTGVQAQREQWRQQAQELGFSLPSLEELASVGPSPDEMDVSVEECAKEVRRSLMEQKGQWTVDNVEAETQRRLRGVAFVSHAAREDFGREVVAEVLNDCLSIDPDMASTPGAFLRSDGCSIYGSGRFQRWTHAEVVSAENQVIDAAGLTGGRSVDAEMLDQQIEESAQRGIVLNEGQEQMVRRLGSSGRRFQVALAAAGTGKTTTMDVLRRAWCATEGTVLATAPAAAAAAELGEAMDTDYMTLAQLRIDLQADARAALAINEKTLIVIDEASMATTPDLQAVTEEVIARGGSIIALGDDRQLASVGAGGIVTDVARVHGAVTLTRSMRFKSPGEAAAADALRAGDPGALAYYFDQGRVDAYHGSYAADSIVAKWREDVDTGKNSLMLAFTRADVAAMNAAAQQHIQRDSQPGVTMPLADGATLRVNDTIITRRNDRSIKCGSKDSVRNGYRWKVVDIAPDGSVTAQRLGSHDTALLPASYVSTHVQHGWAMTVHSAQGQTSDTSHLLVTETSTHHLLYVGMTRGKEKNTLTVQHTGGVDEMGEIASHVVQPTTAMEILTKVVQSAHAEDASANTTYFERHKAEDRYRRDCQVWEDATWHAAEKLCGPTYMTWLTDQIRAKHPELVTASGWPSLRSQLAVIALQRQNPLDAVEKAVATKPVDDAQDSAAVVAWRIYDQIEVNDTRPFPWMKDLPQVVGQDPEYRAFFSELRENIRSAASEIHADMGGGDVPPIVHAHGLAKHPDLARDVHLWRLTHGVDESQQDFLLGTAGASGQGAKVRSRINEEYAAIVREREKLVPEHLHETLKNDPSYHRLLARLADLHDDGHDVGQMLTAAHEQAPLPSNSPSAALWWRMKTYQVGSRDVKWTTRHTVSDTPRGDAQPWRAGLERPTPTPAQHMER